MRSRRREPGGTTTISATLPRRVSAFGRLFVILLAGSLGAEGGASGQVAPPDSTAGDTLAAGPTTPTPPGSVVVFQGLAAASLPRSPVAAVVVRFPDGSNSDREGTEGGTWVLAQLLASEVERRAAAVPAEVSVEVTPEATTFTLVTSAGRWREPLAILGEVVRAPEVTQEEFAAVRGGLHGRLVFEAGAPLREFEQERRRLLGEGIGPGASVTGNPASVEGLTLAGIVESARARFDPVEAVVAVVDAPSATETLSALRGVGSFGSAPAPPIRARAGGTVPWTEGEHRGLGREVTNAWLALAYPVPPEISRTNLEFLAYLLSDRLNPTPPHEGVYRIEATARATEAGQLLLLEATYAPAVAPDIRGWADSVVTLLRDAPPPSDFFRWERRRFRSSRLIEDADPVARAQRIVRDLAWKGEARDLVGEIEALAVDPFLRTVRSLGPARSLVVGPGAGGR